MSNKVGGYEWGFTCGECGTYCDLSGTSYPSAEVNGEQNPRVRNLESGDIISCPGDDCDNTVRLKFVEVTTDA